MLNHIYQTNKRKPCAECTGLTFRPSVPSFPLWPLSPWERRTDGRDINERVQDNCDGNRRNVKQTAGRELNERQTWAAHLEAFVTSFTLKNKHKPQIYQNRTYSHAKFKKVHVFQQYSNGTFSPLGPRSPWKEKFTRYYCIIIIIIIIV